MFVIIFVTKWTYYYIFVIIFVTKWTSDSFLAICRQWPGDHWAVNHYQPQPIRGQYWVELTNQKPSIYCNREEINDPLTCGHRSHSDKLLTANSWSDSGQIARRMRLTPNIICCHSSSRLSLVSQPRSGLSLVRYSLLREDIFVCKIFGNCKGKS